MSEVGGGCTNWDHPLYSVSQWERCLYLTCTATVWVWCGDGGVLVCGSVGVWGCVAVCGSVCGSVCAGCYRC